MDFYLSFINKEIFKTVVSGLLKDIVHCVNLLSLLMVFTLLSILHAKLGTLYLRTLERSQLKLVSNAP